MSGRPMFRDWRMSAALGVVLLGASWLCLHDAWDKRGRRAPLPVRVVTPW
jgi:hypothetical protein